MPPEFIVAIIIVAIVAITLIQVVKTIAATRHGSSASELAQLKQHLEQLAAAQEDSAAQIAELQERVDFAERLLAQTRDRAALGAQHKPE